MIKKIIVFFVFLISLSATQAQNPDSISLKISLLTCAPGDQLYSLFGHSAIRIQNLKNGKDQVYNYGMFSFGEPNFYPNFVRGKLDYWIGRTKLSTFLKEYQYYGRAVLENQIMLNEEEAQAMEKFLLNNLKEENRYYKYDFFFDNCSSRIRDVLEDLLGDQLVWENPQTSNPTFRDLLDQYLGNSPWSDFGIDLILGKPTDDLADFRQQMFLPDFLKANMAAGVVTRNGQQTKLLGPTVRILDFPNVVPAVPLWKRPVFLFTLLLLVIALLTWVFPNGKAWLVFDFLLLFITGVAGSLFLFMWTGTDHQACYKNWNMLWAFPLNLIAAFFLFSKKAFSKKYFLGYGLLVALTLLGWFFWPQRFHVAFIPLMLLILLRIVHRFMLKKHPSDVRIA